MSANASATAGIAACRMWIDGTTAQGNDGGTVEIANPATGETIAIVPRAPAADREGA